jgi:uncharacterized protein (UPF0218 family)
MTIKHSNTTGVQDESQNLDMVSIIDEDTKVLKQLNSDIKRKYSKYLSDTYNPAGKQNSDLNQHVQELTDMKEQEKMLVQVDDALAEVMSPVLDVD